MMEFELIAIIKAAGWPIYPLLIASVIALFIIINRQIELNRSKVLPSGLLGQVLEHYRQGSLDEAKIAVLEKNSIFGRILMAGIHKVPLGQTAVQEAIEDAGQIAAFQMSYFLTTLGTIASIAPIMGLFGTVVGMIEIFGSQQGSVNDPQQLAHGISIALYNTAAGLLVAVPAMIFYRHYRATVDHLLLEMEQGAIRMTESIFSQHHDLF